MNTTPSQIDQAPEGIAFRPLFTFEDPWEDPDLPRTLYRDEHGSFYLGREDAQPSRVGVGDALKWYSDNMPHSSCATGSITELTRAAAKMLSV